MAERCPTPSGGASALEACDEWHSGAYLLETVPCALYILMRHGHDPEEAIVRAVNDAWDNDTVAAIVGAAVGALHGKAALPRRWVDGLLGRSPRMTTASSTGSWRRRGRASGATSPRRQAWPPRRGRPRPSRSVAAWTG